MRTPAFPRWAILLLFVSSLLPCDAHAYFVYQYTGQHYDIVSGDYSSSMRMQGFFQTDALLADGTYDFTDMQDWPVGFNWAFGDSLNAMTANYARQNSLAQPGDQFEVVIAGGRVTAWDIVFADFPFSCHTLTSCTLKIQSDPQSDDFSSYAPGGLQTSPERSVAGGAASSSAVGTWAAPFYVGALPEPGTLALAAIAFAAAWGARLIRRNHHNHRRDPKVDSRLAARRTGKARHLLAAGTIRET